MVTVCSFCKEFEDWLDLKCNLHHAIEEIADSAYRNTRGRPSWILSYFLEEKSVSSHVSKTVADFFFTFLLQMFFLVQAMVVSFLPILGPIISLGHMCLLYSLYTFEYKWVNMGWTAPKRLMYMESNWPYFVGFWIPSCYSYITSAFFYNQWKSSKSCRNKSSTSEAIFRGIWLTNKVFTRRPVTSRTQATGPDSTVGT
ncbi:Etoposide induced 2.4 mRNA [Desmophyllum pertusum]|uniref:Etoposide induced 2.4 mRNA n=1 Tax=Desmophyllum pertusum TaxID=174260 RepID=A0A9X0CCY1_9CNID|nr:Etoposide induced 2.4 mRNA [Desmophyllum pertusum]